MGVEAQCEGGAAPRVVRRNLGQVGLHLSLQFAGWTCMQSMAPDSPRTRGRKCACWAGTAQLAAGREAARRQRCRSVACPSVRSRTLKAARRRPYSAASPRYGLLWARANSSNAAAGSACRVEDGHGWRSAAVAALPGGGWRQCGHALHAPARWPADRRRTRLPAAKRPGTQGWRPAAAPGRLLRPTPFRQSSGPRQAGWQTHCSCDRAQCAGRERAAATATAALEAQRAADLAAGLRRRDQWQPESISGLLEHAHGASKMHSVEALQPWGKSGCVGPAGSGRAARTPLPLLKRRVRATGWVTVYC